MGETCRTYGGEYRGLHDWWGNLKERDYLEDLSVDW